MATEEKEWEILERNRLLKAGSWFEVWQEKVKLPDGRVIPDFYILHEPDACVIVAETADQGVLALRQYKHGIRSTILGLPAGYLQEDENPLTGAQRELREETGYASDQWIPLGQFFRDANRGGTLIHVFFASRAYRIDDPNDGDLETLEVQIVQMDDLVEAVFQNRVKSMGLVGAILMAKTFLDHKELHKV